MSPPLPTLFFDFTDPLSYLVELELKSLGAEGVAVRRSPFELHPPPTPLVVIGDPSIEPRWHTARALASSMGLSLEPPMLVPWSRKAHELVAFAADHQSAPAVRAAIFEAYMVGGLDIGRVDVLVDIGTAAGLDSTETKAVLDVDRHDADVVGAREAAAALAVSDTPVLVGVRGRVEGFHNRVALGTFLRDP